MDKSHLQTTTASLPPPAAAAISRTCKATLVDGRPCYVAKNLSDDGFCRIHQRKSTAAAAFVVGGERASLVQGIELDRQSNDEDEEEFVDRGGAMKKGVGVGIAEVVWQALPISKIGEEDNASSIMALENVALEVKIPRVVPQYQFRLPNHTQHVEELIVRVHEGNADEDSLAADKDGNEINLEALPMVTVSPSPLESAPLPSKEQYAPSRSEISLPATSSNIKCHCGDAAVLRERISSSSSSTRLHYFVCASQRCDFLATQDLGTSLLSVTSAPLCRGHSKPCRLSNVKREGANHGRLFWSCAESGNERQCKSFHWLG
jgi:hypothetical protein